MRRRGKVSKQASSALTVKDVSRGPPKPYAKDRASTPFPELAEGAEAGAVADTLEVRVRMDADERRPFLTLMVVACVCAEEIFSGFS